MIQITFPDQRVKSYPDDTTPMSVAKDLSNSLAAKVLISEVNGQLHDLLRPISGDAEIKFYTFDDTLGRQTYWHSSAHLLAEAIEALYPGVKFGIGPAIERGFYYDIDLPEGQHLSHDDFEKIENKML
ncbi:MAG: TGS domain-containing protein, partial [Chitinophagales bacterium]|nr:TGS domain-containing protein [Chitinophagales bacterium]